MEDGFFLKKKDKEEGRTRVERMGCAFNAEIIGGVRACEGGLDFLAETFGLMGIAILRGLRELRLDGLGDGLDYLTGLARGRGGRRR